MAGQSQGSGRLRSGSNHNSHGQHHVQDLQARPYYLQKLPCGPKERMQLSSPARSTHCCRLVVPRTLDSVLALDIEAVKSISDLQFIQGTHDDVIETAMLRIVMCISLSLEMKWLVGLQLGLYFLLSKNYRIRSGGEQFYSARNLSRLWTVSSDLANGCDTSDLGNADQLSTFEY